MAITEADTPETTARIVSSLVVLASDKLDSRMQISLYSVYYPQALKAICKDNDIIIDLKKC